MVDVSAAQNGSDEKINLKTSIFAIPSILIGMEDGLILRNNKVELQAYFEDPEKLQIEIWYSEAE